MIKSNKIIKLCQIYFTFPNYLLNKINYIFTCESI